MALILPESVKRSLLSEQERYWNPILKGIDPLLRLVAPMSNPPVGMLPDRWHVYREGEHGVPLYHSIQTPEGEFREMDEGVVEALRRTDLRSARSERIRRENQARRDASRERSMLRAKEDRVDNIAARIDNKTRPSILFSGDKRGWTNRAHARKAA